MTLRNSARLAIHRRSDEIAFLQHRLRAFRAELTRHNAPPAERDPRIEVLARERDLADELLHTRQTEPLGETLQRRLAMAERICRDLTPRTEPLHQHPSGSHLPSKADGARDAGECQGEQSGEQDEARFGTESQDRLPDAYWVAKTERQALAEMLEQWWAWLNGSAHSPPCHGPAGPGWQAMPGKSTKIGP